MAFKQYSTEQCDVQTQLTRRITEVWKLSIEVKGPLILLVKILNVINEDLVTVSLFKCEDNTMTVVEYIREKLELLYLWKTERRVKGKFPKLLTRLFITNLLIVSKLH